MNIVSCHVFAKSSVLAVILTWHNALVPYYLSKVFVIVEIEVVGVDNIPISVKEQISAADLRKEEITLTCKADIP